jgi:anti-sigma factor RsiW
MTCDDVIPLLLLQQTREARVADHLASCARCREQASTLGAVARTLAAYPDPVAPRGLGPAVLHAAAPLLAGHSRRAAGWRLVRAFAAALLPLPLIVLVDVGLLSMAYRLLSTVLPEGLSLYLVFNQAVLLALLFALTYGSIPLLAARQAGGLAEESHG